MNTDKMNIWNQLNEPPKWALKQITGGDLKGMTDIKPQWRMEAMTSVFGPCGRFWKYEIVDRWKDEVTVEKNGKDQTEQLVFIQSNLYYWDIDTEGWSDPIPGIGGSTVAMATKYGLKAIDEAYKMALTDSLSVSMKALGVAAKIYSGMWDSKYQKYKDEAPAQKVQTHKKQVEAKPSTDNAFGAREALLVKFATVSGAYLKKLAGDNPAGELHYGLARKICTDINADYKKPADLSVAELKKCIAEFQSQTEALDQPVAKPAEKSEMEKLAESCTDPRQEILTNSKDTSDPLGEVY